MKKVLRITTTFVLTAIIIFQLLGIHGLSFAFSDASSSKKEGFKIFEDDTCTMYGKGERKEKDIHWQIKFKRKEITEKRKLSFLLMKEDIILGKDYVDVETIENFHYVKPFWQKKDASIQVDEFISFRTPNEDGWVLRIYDGKEDEPIPPFQEFKTIILSENYVTSESATEDSTRKDENIAESDSGEGQTSEEKKETMLTKDSSEEVLSTTEGKTEEVEVDAVTGVTKGEDELAPENAILINDIFDKMRSEPANPAPFYSKHSQKNYYTGLQTFSEFGPNDPRKNRVYYLAGNKNRMSVFSKDNYRLDFSKSFQGMVYISLGVNKADGMTFTLHNDPRKAGTNGPLSTSDKGGALGVYAKRVKDLTLLENLDLSSSIENSISIEFDMHFNDNGDPYDANISTEKGLVMPHVALTYPGSIEGYDDVRGFLHDYRVIHTNTKDMTGYTVLGYQNAVKRRVDPDNPIEINWNELEFSYDAIKKELIFDLYLPSKKGREKIWSQTVEYPYLRDRLKIEENGFKAYWGFTAANGSASGMDGFAVAKIPLNFSVENRVYKNGDTDITLDSPQGNREEKHATEEEEIRLAGKITSGDGQGNVTEGILELNSINMIWDKDVLPIEKIKQLKIQKLDSSTNAIINETSYSKEELNESIWQDNEDNSGKKIQLTNPFNTLNENEHLWVVMTFENGILDEGRVDREGFQTAQFQMQATTKNGVTQSGPPAYFALKMFGEAEFLIVPNFYFGKEDGKTSLSYLHENKVLPLNRVLPTAGQSRENNYYFPIDFYLLDRRSLADKEKNPLTIHTKFDFYSNDGGLNTFTPEMKLKYRKKEDFISEESIIDDNQTILINQENTQIAIVEANTKRIELDFHTYLDEGLLDFSKTLLPNEAGVYKAIITWSLENVPKP